MKKKLFTLLTLLCLCVTGAWAADSTPTYTQPSSTLDLSSSSLATTLSGISWKDKNSNYGTFYKLSDDYLELPCVPLVYSIGTKSGTITWAVQENSRGNTNTATWNASAPFSVWTDFRVNDTKTSLDVPKLQTTRMIAVKVTGITEAKIYAATGSSNYIVLNVYEVGAEQGSVAYNTLTLAGTANTNTANIATVSSLDASKTYIVQAVGKANNANIYAMALKRALTATQAPSTPTLTVDGGNVNGGSKTTIASSDAQKIFYCWTNSPTAPAQNAENTWTEAKGASYEYTIPNVSATGMYLHAYGWNNYNTSSASATKTSAAFNVTKVKQAAGLSYATAAVEKNVSANKFINALTNPNNLTVTYSVVDGATATGVSVDASTGEVTVGSVAGTATIKAYFAGNDDYNAGEATYTLTVVTPDPVIEAANVNISKTATGGNIAYNVGYHSAHNGNVTATTDADWITLGTVALNANGSGTVAFTNSANTTPVTRYANVTLTYTYNTNSTKTTTMIVAQDPNLVGFSIIKVAVTDYNAGTATGTIGGNATVSLENSSLGGGYKFGKKAYITLTLANSKTFEEGDVIVVHTTKAADTTPGTLAMYSGDDLVLNTGTRGILGINAFALPAAAEGKTSIAVKRTDTYNWNGYVDYIEVIRTTTTVTTNAGGWASFTPGSNCTLSEGAQAYIVTDVNSTSVEVTPVTTLEKGKGYFIQGQEASHAYTATATTASADATTGNLLKGCATATEISATAPSPNDKYVLGTATTGDNEGKSGLFLVDSNITVGAGKAYLQTGNTQGARFLSLIVDGETTSISNLNVNDNANIDANAPMYNLAGQKVGKNYKGIVIVNGKKVVRK